MLRHLDRNKELPKVTLLTALQVLVSAWNDVSENFVVNCFRKAKISEKAQANALNDEDDPFKELSDDLKELREKDPSLVPENMTAETLAYVDDEVITKSAPLTDENILEEFMILNEKEVDDASDEAFVDEEMITPSAKEVENALEVLKNYSLFNMSRGSQMQGLLYKFETFLNMDKAENYKQASILNFFDKEKEKLIIFEFLCYLFPYFPLISFWTSPLGAPLI